MPRFRPLAIVVGLWFSLVAFCIAIPDANLATIPCEVTRVVDGDTFTAIIQGQEMTVRLIGIDAPESKHPQKPAQYWGPESSEKLKQAIEGKSLLLEMHEIPSEPTDRYGRLLCYAYFADASAACINEVAVSSGWARSYQKYPCKYTERFDQLEAEARAQRAGMWQDDASAMAIEQEEIRADLPLRSPYDVGLWPPPQTNIGDEIELLTFVQRRIKEALDASGLSTESRRCLRILSNHADSCEAKIKIRDQIDGPWSKSDEKRLVLIMKEVWDTRSKIDPADIESMVKSNPGLDIERAAWRIHIVRAALRYSKATN